MCRWTLGNIFGSLDPGLVSVGLGSICSCKFPTCWCFGVKGSCHGSFVLGSLSLEGESRRSLWPVRKSSKFSRSRPFKTFHAFLYPRCKRIPINRKPPCPFRSNHPLEETRNPTRSRIVDKCWKSWQHCATLSCERSLESGSVTTRSCSSIVCTADQFGLERPHNRLHSCTPPVKTSLAVLIPTHEVPPT